MNAIESNKLIAQFMGWRYDGELNHFFDGFGKGYSTVLYHNSWDWLMPVVEKIESLEYTNRQGRFSLTSINFDENYTVCITDNEDSFIQVDGETKILSTYQAVVQFIQWYNQNLKP